MFVRMLKKYENCVKRVPELKECEGCMACEYACPVGAIEVKGKKPIINDEKCISCFNCVEVCKEREINRKAKVESYIPKNCKMCNRCRLYDDLESCIYLSDKMKRAIDLILNPDKVIKYPIEDKTIPTKTGLFEVGSPDKSSPVLVTGNYLYTVSNVVAVLDYCSIDAYVLCLDTSGYCTTLAITLGYFRGLENYLSLILDKVFHRILILPKQAKILNFEKSLGEKWDIVYGPRRLEELPAFLIKNWKKILEEYVLESMI